MVDNSSGSAIISNIIQYNKYQSHTRHFLQAATLQQHLLLKNPSEDIHRQKMINLLQVDENSIEQYFAAHIDHY